MYRLIPFETFGPYLKTALNDIVIEYVQKTQIPIIWLSGWDQNCVNIGVSQNPQKVLNIQKVLDDNLPIIRRQSGGGATYLTKEGEISWAIIAPKDEFPSDLHEIYKSVSQTIISALEKLNISAEYKPINDIVTKNGKISGATLRKENNIVYIAGTLIFKTNKEKMNEILRPENDDLKKEKIKEIDKNITSIFEESDASFQESIEALESSLTQGLEIKKIPFSEKELKKAHELSLLYRNKEWIYHGKR